MCLKGFFNEVGSKVKYRLNFNYKNTSSTVRVISISFILGYIIDMLLLFKEIKFGYGTDMGSGDILFFICGCTGKYNKNLTKLFSV